MDVVSGLGTRISRFRASRRQTFPYWIMEGLPVTRPERISTPTERTSGLCTAGINYRLMSVTVPNQRGMHRHKNTWVTLAALWEPAVIIFLA